MKSKLKKAQQGGVSVKGYLPGSPDRDNDFNIIPGGHITMDQVPHAVIGIPDVGMPKFMPANSGLHRFIGANHVAEIPVRQMGGDIEIIGGSPDDGRNDKDTGQNYMVTKDPNVYMGRYGIPITRSQFNQNQKSDMPFNSFEAYADWVGGWARKPLDLASSGIPVQSAQQPAGSLPGDQKTQPGLSDKARGLSNIYYLANSQHKVASPETIHSTSGYYQYGGDSADPMASLSASDLNVLNQSANPQAPDTQPQGLDPVLKQVTEDPGYTKLNPVTNKPFPNNAAYPDMAINTLNMMSEILNRREDSQQMAKIKDRFTSDAIAPVTPADISGNRGDYDVNSGMFRPDANGVKSPYGMYKTNYKNGGELPKAMYGTSLMPDMMNVHDVFDGGNSTPAPSGPGPYSGLSPFVTTPDPSFHGFEPAAKALPVSDTARTAYDYYINRHNLSPQVAAGIVGNLYQESGLKPNATEKDNTANGRGIAQWDARNRWPALLDWAKKQGRDPYDLHTQLDYVLVEPGWGDKALQQTSNAQSPQEAAMIFGKYFERPNEKFAEWNKRTGYAQSLANQYQEGGEYEVDENELKQILKNGGQVEYL